MLLLEGQHVVQGMNSLGALEAPGSSQLRFLIQLGHAAPAPLYKLAGLHISSIASPLLCCQSLDFRPHNAVLSAFLAWSNFDWGGCFLSLLHTGSPHQIGVDDS